MAEGDVAADNIGEMTFEAAMAELEGIVEKLENGQVALEESIRIYERGDALRRHCDALLKRAEEKVEKITIGADGQATGVTPLDVE